MPREHEIFQAIVIAAFFVVMTVAAGALASMRDNPAQPVVVGVLQLHDE